jgi:hypothetical protein
MKKRFFCFTIFEILIVILIIWLLFWAIKQIFTYKQRDFLKANTCVNTIVWDVTNYFYSALTSKWIKTWNIIVYPKRYIIVFSGDDQKVVLSYFSWDDTNGSTWDYKIYNLTGSDENSPDEDIQYWCYSNKYYVYLSWNLSVVMQPWLEWWSWRKGILINGQEWNKTWEVYFKFVWYWYTGKVLGKLVIDKRVNSLYYSQCLVWTGWWTQCKKWSN